MPCHVAKTGRSLICICCNIGFMFGSCYKMMAVWIEVPIFCTFLALKVSPIASLVSIFGSYLPPSHSVSAFQPLEELHFTDGFVFEHGWNSSPASAPGHHVAAAHPRS